MAKKHAHEDHINHEAWAIPYGDLVTLLLAFFVVMYAVSSVNEGKYRVLADSLSSAFGGQPRSVAPIQLGQTQLRGSSFDRPSMVTPAMQAGPSVSSPVKPPRMRQMLDMPTFGGMRAQEAAATAQRVNASGAGAGSGGGAAAAAQAQLHAIGQRLQQALSSMVAEKLVTVRRSHLFLEVEIQSDILFASGEAAPSAMAVSTVRRIGEVLRGEPNAVRVEGYTDNLPIATARFPSNWELSSARAASVVHEMVRAGVAAPRLAVVGYGEHSPVADNATVEGRNANRRVLLVILAAPQGADAVVDKLPPSVREPQAVPTAPTVAALPLPVPGG